MTDEFCRKFSAFYFVLFNVSTLNLLSIFLMIQGD